MDLTIGVSAISESFPHADRRPLSDKLDILSSERRLRFLMLPLAFGGGSRSGTSLSGLPGPGYEESGLRPIRRDGNGIIGALSPIDCCSCVV